MTADLDDAAAKLAELMNRVVDLVDTQEARIISVPVKANEKPVKPCRVCGSGDHTQHHCRGRGLLVCLICDRPQRDHELDDMCGTAPVYRPELREKVRVRGRNIPRGRPPKPA